MHTSAYNFLKNSTILCLIFSRKFYAVPTAFIEEGYRFKIYLNDHAPAHCHVQSGEKEARIMLVSVEMMSNIGFHSRELTRIVKLVEKHQDLLLEMWDTYHESR